MSILFCVALLWVFISPSALASLTVCPANDQLYLSIDRDLLPTANVRASSDDSGFNSEEDFIASGSNGDIPWCSDPESTLAVQDQFVEVNFTEPVVVTLVQSSGYFNAHVNLFRIEYGMLDGDLQLYTVNEEPRDFEVKDLILRNALFTLERPIRAQRLRFRVQDALLDSFGRVCWGVLIYGCTDTKAVTLDDPPSVTDTPATTSTCPPGSSEISADDILIIALPVALGTIAVVLVIVIVAVIACFSCQSSKPKKSAEPADNLETVKVDMSTEQTSFPGMGCPETPKSNLSFIYDHPRIQSYDVPRSLRSRAGSEGGSSDLLSGTFEIKNPLYSLKRNRTGNQDEPDNSVFVPADSNDYEMIPGSDQTHAGRHNSLPPTAQRSPDPPPSLPVRTHTYSLVRKKNKAIHSSTQDVGTEAKERVNTCIYNKLSKVAGSDPMFNVVYDEPPDSDIDSSVV